MDLEKSLRTGVELLTADPPYNAQKVWNNEHALQYRNRSVDAKDAVSLYKNTIKNNAHGVKLCTTMQFVVRYERSIMKAYERASTKMRLCFRMKARA